MTIENETHISCTDDTLCKPSTPRGFEPLRAEPNGFLVHLLNHSDTVSLAVGHCVGKIRICIPWIAGIAVLVQLMAADVLGHDCFCGGSRLFGLVA